MNERERKRIYKDLSRFTKLETWTPAQNWGSQLTVLLSDGVAYTQQNVEGAHWLIRDILFGNINFDLENMAVQVWSVKPARLDSSCMYECCSRNGDKVCSGANPPKSFPFWGFKLFCLREGMTIKILLPGEFESLSS